MTKIVKDCTSWLSISTHTLTWSVTRFPFGTDRTEVISTHTLTWSVTGVKGASQPYVGHFNSHAHVERDYSQTVKRALKVNFNSHAHVERDVHVKETPPETNISTHTLTWSVTLAMPIVSR